MYMYGRPASNMMNNDIDYCSDTYLLSLDAVIVAMFM